MCAWKVEKGESSSSIIFKRTAICLPLVLWKVQIKSPRRWSSLICACNPSLQETSPQAADVIITPHYVFDQRAFIVAAPDVSHSTMHL